MQKIFTLFYNVSKLVGAKKNKSVSAFLENGLNDRFAPSDQSIKNILAFSDAYYQHKSESIGKVETLLN